MANMPQSSNDNILTNAPVLVQNQLGIFYGTLKKYDTRSGTALLESGFMITPERHITFLQYLNFLNGVVEELLMGIALNEDSDDTDPYEKAEKLFPNEISISNEEYQEHKRNLSITDYATEGIYLAQFRTRTYWNTGIVQVTSPSISLTGVMAIVDFDISQEIIHQELMALVSKDVSGLGLVESVLGFDVPEFKVVDTFDLISKNIKGIEDTYYLNLPKLVINTEQRVNNFNHIDSDEQNT